MKLTAPTFTAVWLWIVSVSLSAVTVEAASPSAADALKLMPIQPGVDISQPDAVDVPKCKITAKRVNGKVGWVVEDANGVTLRRFVDTNGDNVVDQWSYFKEGLEVYRDIDADFNGKADQYRWFHTAGSRWGLDENEDGTIDAWKTISAEEVTAEVIAALAGRDTGRFTRLLLTSGELASLGLGKERAASLAAKIERAATDFQTLISRQKTVTSQSEWIQFSGGRPGLVPAGTEGSTKDLRVYENVTAIVQSGEEHGQVPIGTLVQVGDVWRVIDVPRGLDGGQPDFASLGFFFQAPASRPDLSGAVGASEESQKLLAELEKLDQEAAGAATPQQQAAYNARRADLLEKIAFSIRSPQERAMWLRQLADMISAAVQSGGFSDGVKRLESLLEKLEGANADKDLVAHVTFVKMTAEYTLSFQADGADFAEIQAKWLKGLEQFVSDFPGAPDTAEAMLQLAIAQEFAGKEDEAKKWYGRIVASFPDSPAAKKAAGARTRLDSVGKTIQFSGKSPSGGVVDLARYRGRVVLIQYWATWSERAKSDMAVLKELLSKYGRSLSIIGVNLDSSAENLTKYLAENRLPWPQIYEAGGLDSPPANQLGILTLPTMILVDKQGRVVNRNIQTTELDRELKKLIP